MWRLVFTKRAEKDFFRLEKEVSKRIIAKLEKTTKGPKQHFSLVKGTGYCKLRIGDFRVLVVLQHTKKLIDVRRVDHRRNIYKNL